MRSTLSLMPILTVFLIAGCASPEPVASTEAAFCDVEEPRRFSQAELDWRAANAPWNLRRDFKTNATGTRECGWFGAVE